jgi:hypothetical protein
VNSYILFALFTRFTLDRILTNRIVLVKKLTKQHEMDLSWVQSTPIELLINEVASAVQKSPELALEIALELLLRDQIATSDNVVQEILRLLERKFEPHPRISYKVHPLSIHFLVT